MHHCCMQNEEAGLPHCPELIAGVAGCGWHLNFEWVNYCARSHVEVEPGESAELLHSHCLDWHNNEQ